MVFISRAYTRIAPESQAALLPAQSLDRRAHRRRSLVRRGQRPRRAIAQAFDPRPPQREERRARRALVRRHANFRCELSCGNQKFELRYSHSPDGAPSGAPRWAGGLEDCICAVETGMEEKIFRL